MLNKNLTQPRDTQTHTQPPTPSTDVDRLTRKQLFAQCTEFGWIKKEKNMMSLCLTYFSLPYPFVLFKSSLRLVVSSMPVEKCA